ncbi:MAG: peroxiredoxin family protein [Psychroflexus halocasei]|uniref:peroxiredoxin family protein n=1 Tax=Psychroflexus sp. S27 TaxID=1982757 RepID=UPI000C2B1BF5|nr:TlpA disulfide reductase family protein [Psychroflexus sp. S27]PJX21792.1 hypothetical protein CAP47_09220 [Psychroflexus sp. S27]
MYKSLKVSVFTVSALLLLSSCNFGESKSSEETKDVKVEQKSDENSNLKEAPQFEVTTIQGEQVSLKQSVADNKPIMVYFTASWCPMCAQNWPAISEVYPEYKDRVNFVAISIDPTDDEDVMTKLAEEHNIDFPLVKGTPQVMLDFGVQKQATTVGVNKSGSITFEERAVFTADEYRELFEQLLN